jgi:hypothetical protein
LARVLAWIARTTLAMDRAINAALATTVAWTGAICAVIALQILLIITHKPWLDEWQAVLIAVQTPTWPDLLAALRMKVIPRCGTRSCAVWRTFYLRHC